LRHRAEFDHEVVVEECWIPAEDGTRLHARIWRPKDSSPVPALLEYLPYRKGDWTAPRDAQRHPWYAGHGYASVRVDLRGSGNSEGVMLDEYTDTELSDAIAVIDWLATRPWCNGKVGMFGISWGGFNALQVAALRPEPLKAIVTVCSTDDRYDNDVHYTGGAVLGVDMAAWGGTMLAFTARPPDPAVVGDRWLPMWRERLEAAEPFVHTWLSHQERDDYWRHGSVCEDYSAVQAAVLAVGGWADPYRDTVFRLAEHLSAPVRGIVGPWSHQYPDRELPPGPAIGFLQETLRWWDYWLKGVDNDVMDTPLLRTWMQDPAPPSTFYAQRSGRWVSEDSWPSKAVTAIRYGFDAELSPGSAVSGGVVQVASPQHTGIDAGRFFPFGNRSDLPPDQREEDGRSACFDSEPLTERVEILGRPRLSIRLGCDVERANLAVRLCDVAPDGSSTLVTRGLLNLLARSGREHVQRWRPDQVETVEFDLSAVAYAFPPGHRIRVAASTSYFPWVWPHGTAARMEVHPADSAMFLPVRDPSDDAERAPVVFYEAEQAPPLEVHSDAVEQRPERVVRRDVAVGEWILEVDPHYGGSRRFPDGLTYAEETTETYRIREHDPLSAKATSHWRISLSREGWHAEIRATTDMTATDEEFLVDSQLATFSGGEEVVSRRWHERIPRTSA
jgi:uncharacterized protein